MELIVRAPFYDPSGYSYLARKLTIATYKKGITIQGIHIPNINVRCPLTRDEADILEVCEKTRITGRAPLLNICIAHSFVLDINRFSMGLSMLESTRIIPNWTDNCNRMDLVMVPSTFNVKTFIDSGVNPKKLILFPLGVDTSYFNPNKTEIDEVMRERWLPKTVNDETFVFFSNFEWIQRKNPDILLHAYCESFTEKDNVALVLKVYSGGTGFDRTGQTILTKVHEFLEQNGYTNHPKIIIIPTLLTEAEMGALYRMTDCYITTTSGEGWALPISEAMATKKPVIATNWSAYLDFLDNTSGYLIDVEDLIDVPELGTESSPLYRDSKWAKPSLESTKACMRSAYEHREEGKEKGEVGYKKITNEYTWDHAADRLISVLTQTIDVWKPPEREVSITVNEPLKVAMIVPSLDDSLCGINEYSKALRKGLAKYSSENTNKIEVRTAKTFIKNYNDLVDCHIINYQFEYSLFTKYMLEREFLMIKDKKISLTQHSVVTHEFHVNDTILNSVDQVIVHSPEMRNYLSRPINRAEVLLIPHGCENFGIENEHATELKPSLNIGTFGFMYPQKGFIETMLAVNLLRERGLDTKLTMLCSVNEKNHLSNDYATRVQMFYDSLNADNFITWNKDFLTKEEIVTELHKCDLILLPYHEMYRQYGVSGAVRTAMASLRPILITDNIFFSDVKDLLITVSESDIATITHLADILYSTYLDIDLRNQTQNNIEKFITKNSWPSIAKRHVEVWNRLVGRK